MYVHRDDVAGMIATLEPYHKMTRGPPQTLAELTFQQAFGRQLEDAWACVARYQRSGSRADLDAAWVVYKQCYDRIVAKNRAMSKLELALVSPHLHAARDLELAVPGTYLPNAPFTRITSFTKRMDVIVSKQRPRKLSLRGDDGVEYGFLLKGKEDLRQDERVMQLFGLVNTLLGVEADTAPSSLSIITYSVIPLSPTSGLLRWVPNAPTLNTLINNQRKARRIELSAEKDFINRQSPKNMPQGTRGVALERPYDGLPLLQKVAVFDAMLEATRGDALAQVLWLTSQTAERWVERRTKYARSLAVMSMVGYILGLGDRHPSNLMLDRLTGKILHIDFGDCFEVAIHRDKYPETVPFRLTRMLVKAMGVEGVEGNYRSTCEAVMAVMRRHKDSVMAMLEAFLHDPMANWHLMEEDAEDEAAGAGGADDGGGLDVKRGPTRIDRNADSLIVERRLAINPADGAHAVDERKLNARAMEVLQRVEDKLIGTDEPPEPPRSPRCPTARRSSASIGRWGRRRRGQRRRRRRRRRVGASMAAAAAGAATGGGQHGEGGPTAAGGGGARPRRRARSRARTSPRGQSSHQRGAVACQPMPAVLGVEPHVVTATPRPRTRSDPSRCTSVWASPWASPRAAGHRPRL